MDLIRSMVIHMYEMHSFVDDTYIHKITRMLGISSRSSQLSLLSVTIVKLFAAGGSLQTTESV